MGTSFICRLVWQNFLFSSFCEDYDTVLTTVFYFTWSLWMEDGSSMNEIKFKSYRAFTVIVPYLEGAECCVRVRCLNWFKNPPCSSLLFPRLSTPMSSAPATTMLSSSSSGKVTKPITENQPPPSLSMSTNPNGPETRATTATRLRGGFYVRYSLKVLF